MLFSLFKFRDRAWYAKVCEYVNEPPSVDKSVCQAQKMKITSEIKPKKQDEVIETITSVFCSKGADMTISLQKTVSKSNTQSITTGYSESFSFGESISVELSAGFEVFGLGGTMNTGHEKNSGRSFEWSQEKKHEISKETSITSSHSLTFEGIY